MFEYDDVNDEYILVLDKQTQDNKPRSYRRSSSIGSRSQCSLRSQNLSPPARVVTRRGRLNTFQLKRPKKNFLYFRDLGNTLLNIQWRWIIITLFVVNFITFFVFGLMWMWVAYVSGDLEKDVKEFCIVNTNTFTGYFLLSVETMLTIGYGYRYPTEKCVQGWIVPFLQALISVGIQGALVSAIYVKITKPITKNLGLFSKKAVICLRDGKLCFIVKITDTLGKIAIGTKIYMYFINKNEHDVNTFTITELHVQPYGFPIFPIEIVHVIDSRSPMYKMTPQEFLIDPMEIIIVAEGISQITAQASQSRISYVNSDILWGHRFVSCVDFDTKKEKFVINYKNVDRVWPVNTPLCSAQQLDFIAKRFLTE